MTTGWPGHLGPLQTETPTETPSSTGVPLPDWLAPFVSQQIFDLVQVVVVVVLTYYASKIARRVLGRRVARRFRRPSVTRTVLRGIQGLVLFLGGLYALSILGLQISDLAISLSVFSAVVGFVLAPIIGSVVSGVFVLSERPYEIGDLVRIVDTDTYGYIEDITLRYTKIFTLDNTFLVVPNGSMRDRDVINFSAEDARTRLQLDVMVTYESDVEEARALIERAAKQVDAVIEGGPDIRIGSARYPAAPSCYIENFGDHGVNLRLRYWATEPFRLLTIRSKVQTNVWERLDDAEVEIAYPHSHLVFDETSGEMQVGVRERGSDGAEARARKRREPRGENETLEGEQSASGNEDAPGSGEGSDGRD